MRRALLLLAAAALGCNTPTLEIPPVPPGFEPTPETPAIAFKTFGATIREGVIVGREYPGYGFKWRWTALVDEAHYEEAGRQQLRALGFETPEPPTDPFETELDARYWLAATLVRWQLDSVMPIIPGIGTRRAQAKGRFLWKMYDAEARDVVLEQAVEGYAKVPFSQDAIEPALIDSLRRLLAEPAFAELMRVSAEPAPGTASP